MKKIYFYFAMIFILKNIQPHDEDTQCEFKKKISNLTKKQDINTQNRKKLIQTVVQKLNLNDKYMSFFNFAIKKTFQINNTKDLLRIFHPDTCPDQKEKNKINILREHFSNLFFHDEKTENKNLEENEKINLEKLLKIHQNLQIATLFAVIISKAIIFRLCVSRFKRLQTKMLGILLSSIFLTSIPILLINKQEYIYQSLKDESTTILCNAAINTLLWNYFIKDSLNKVYGTTAATCLLHILFIPILYRKELSFCENSFISGKILDFFFKQYINKNIYKENNYKKNHSLLKIREK